MDGSHLIAAKPFSEGMKDEQCPLWGVREVQLADTHVAFNVHIMRRVIPIIVICEPWMTMHL